MARPLAKETQQLERLEGAMLCLVSAVDFAGIVAVRIALMGNRLSPRYDELVRGAEQQLGELVDLLDDAHVALREELAVLQAERTAKTGGEKLEVGTLGTR